MPAFSLLPLVVLSNPMVQDMPAPAPETPQAAPPASELCDPDTQPHNQSVEACQLNTTAKEEAEDLDNQVIEGRERPGFNTSLPDRVDQNNPGAVRAPPPQAFSPDQVPIPDRWRLIDAVTDIGEEAPAEDGDVIVDGYDALEGSDGVSDAAEFAVE